MSVALTNAQVRFLRGQAHDLKAMLQVGGKGVTDALVAEVDLALEHHELIKIRIPGMDRDDKRDVIEVICERTGADLVQAIGHMAVLFRKRSKDSQINLPH